MTGCQRLRVLLAGLMLVLIAPAAAAPPQCSILINLPALRLYLYRDGQLLHDYPVAVGKASTPTPVGEFSIICKVRNPVWYPPGKKPVPPGPENPLGEWWLGLSAKGYGIHGNRNESSIGQAVSLGCIRMHNRDIAQLVQFVGTGVPVKIVYQPFALREDPDTGLSLLWVGNDIYRRASVAAALAFMHAAATLTWHEPLLHTLLAKGLESGWHEVPRPVEAFVREQRVGVGYQCRGQLWFPRADLKSLPGWERLAAGGGDVGLEELSLAAAETLTWRYNPSTRTITFLPARLRMGDEVREDAVRVHAGRVMIKTEALADLVGETVETVRAALQDPFSTAGADTERPGETWSSIGWGAFLGWRLIWSEETWEVLVEENPTSAGVWSAPL